MSFPLEMSRTDFYLLKYILSNFATIKLSSQIRVCEGSFLTLNNYRGKKCLLIYANETYTTNVKLMEGIRPSSSIVKLIYWDFSIAIQLQAQVEVQVPEGYSRSECLSFWSTNVSFQFISHGHWILSDRSRMYLSKSPLSVWIWYGNYGIGKEWVHRLFSLESYKFRTRCFGNVSNKSQIWWSR